VRAGGALRALRLALALGPRQRGAVGLRRVGRGQHDRRGLVLGPLGAQALDGAGQRELRAAEALDEVAAAADAERLERAERVVQQAETAAHALGEHVLARDDAVALEQQLGTGAAAQAGIGLATEDRGRERPASLHGRSGAAAPRAEPAAGPRAIDGALGPGERQARSSQRCEGVIGDLARPDEVPQRLLDLLGAQRQLGEQVREEAR
jgi:hypothetical protein